MWIVPYFRSGYYLFNKLWADYGPIFPIHVRWLLKILVVLNTSFLVSNHRIDNLRARIQTRTSFCFFLPCLETWIFCWFFKSSSARVWFFIKFSNDCNTIYSDSCLLLAKNFGSTRKELSSFTYISRWFSARCFILIVFLVGLKTWIF